MFRPMFRNALFAAGLTALALLSVACTGTHGAAIRSGKTVHALPSATVSGVALRHPRAGLVTAGQPAAGDWNALAAAGIRAVINLRPQAEMQGRDERAEVAAAGMRYIELPIATSADITPESAQRLAALLGEAEGPVLVHCGSGNRVGGLLAVAMAQSGMQTDEAIEFGRGAGMKSTESRAREIIEQQRVAFCATDARKAADPLQCPAGG
jgi:uncharacterized protein (TIGR01244 family)